MKIGIIGGGITGLTLAYLLSKSGKYEITILEKEQNVGGLASGLQIGNTNIERFYHHIFKTDTDIINLTKELGIENMLEWHKSSTAIFYKDKLYPFMTPIDLIKFKPITILSRIRTGIMGLYLTKTSKWHKFEGISAASYVLKFCGKSAYNVIWEPLLKGKFGDKYDKIAMSWLWARINTRGKSKVKGTTGEKLGYFLNGFSTFISTLENACIKNKVIIKTNQNITSLMSNDFDIVVATVPNNVFAMLGKDQLPSEYINRLNDIEYYGAICIVLEMNQSLMPYYWLNVNDRSIPFTALIEHTNLIDKSHYDGSNIVYIGQYLPQNHEYFTKSDKEIEDIFLPFLKKINLNYDRNWIKKVHIFRAKTAQHIVTLNYQLKIIPYVTPIENVYLSNFSQIYPQDRGTNFAVQEGRKIYELIEKRSQGIVKY